MDNGTVKPFFTVVTPTLQRESLVACCESVNAQTFADGWHHVIMADVETLDHDLINRIAHPQRVIVKCDHPYRDWANTPRWLAWEHATGEYLAHVDDDNVLYSPTTLAEMHRALVEASFPNFAIFPIFRHGSVFYNFPPAVCMTDTGNIVVKREIGRWPKIPDSTSDGIFAVALYEKYGCVGFRQTKPIIHMRESHQGRGVRPGEGMQ